MPRFPFVVLLSALPCVTLAAHAADAPAQPTPAPAAPAAPATQPATPAPAGDWSDHLKKISLGDGTWVSFSGELRERYEYWNNWNTGNAFGGFLLSRVLAGADFHLSDTFRVFVQGKFADCTDRDLPGGRSTLYVDEGDLQQGYLEVTLPKAGELESSVKAGRLGLNFGKQRLVSVLPWSNTERAWDGVDTTLKAWGWQADAFFTQFVPVQKYAFNSSDRQTLFYGAYFTGPVAGEHLKADAYYLGYDQSDMTNSWNGTTGREERHTIGTRWFGKDGETGIDYDVEGAYQFGRVGAGDVNAYMFASEVGWNAEDAWKTRIHGGFDYASGDGKKGGSVGTFNQLYPLGHAYFGQIDMIGRENIVDLSLGVSTKPEKSVTLTGEAHHFWRANNADAIYNAGGAVVATAANLTSSNDVGTELDAKVNWKTDAHLTLEAGYGHLFAGKAFDTGKSTIGNGVDFVYTQATYSF